MARKRKHIVLKVIGILVAIIVALPVALQLVLNSRIATGIVDKIAAENIDAELSYSDIRISLFRRFPKVRVSVDSLALTYPHDRYSQFDKSAVPSPLLAEGRGEVSDTLAYFSRFTAAVNVVQLLSNKSIRLSDARLSDLKLYAHSYNDSTANWNIFRSSPKDEPDTAGALTLPAISVGKVRIDKWPRVVYTAQGDTVFADLSFRRFALQGDVKVTDNRFRTRNVGVSLDSLRVSGRLPADTLSLKLDSLRVNQCGRRLFDVALGADAMYCSHSLGRLDVPVRVDGRIGYALRKQLKAFDIEHLDADIAYIPLHAEGKLAMWPDSTRVDASLAIKDCKVGRVLDKYGRKFTPLARDISTNASLNLDVKADGLLASGTIPKIDAALRIPRGSVTYKPLETTGTLGLDIKASVSPKKYVKADLKSLSVDIPGLVLDATARVVDLLGKDPAFDVNALADLQLEKLAKYIPEGVDLKARGDLHADIEAKATKSQLNKYSFDKASLKGSITGGKLSARMGEMAALLAQPEVNISSDTSGILLGINADTVFFKNGAALSARVRGMKNEATVSKVEQNSRFVPKVTFSNSDKSLFVKAGANRVVLSDARVAAAMQGRPRQDRSRMKSYLDSLQRVYPDVPRDSLPALIRKKFAGRPLPSFMAEEDFRKSDIKVDLGESVRKLLQRWSPSGSLYAGKGFFASPAFPLRTRIGGVDIDFTDNDLNISKLAVKSGTSDISASGKVTGLRGVLMGRGFIRADMDINSSRINVNEIISAFAVGKDVAADQAGDEDSSTEMDESFVVDTLENVLVESDSMSLIVVPANLIASVHVKADTVNYSDITVNPMSATVNVGKRCVQITDTEINSDYGDIKLDAYYSTQSKEDIAAGLNLKLGGVSAEKIINLLPSVDTLMPLLRSFKGDLGCDVAVTTQLDTNMNVIMPTVDGVVHISGQDLLVEDAGSLRKITKLLLFKNKDIGRIQDMYVDAVVHDNKLEVFPFILSVDRYKLALAGMQDFDDIFNYHVSMINSPFLIKFGLNLYGTFDKWQFMLCRAKYRDGVPTYTREIDQTRVNIARSIKNICETGVQTAMLHSVSANEALAEKKRQTGFDSITDAEELSGSEQLQIDDLALDSDLDEVEARMQAEMDAQIDAMVSETLSNSAALQEEYESLMYNKRISNKLDAIRKDKKSGSSRK